MSQKKDSSALVKKIYIIENLDCANCAAAVERRLNAMPEVTEAVLTFATKQLRITAEDPDNLLDKIRAEASAVEPGVEIYPRTRSRKNKTTSAHSAEASHEHEHTHEHHHESSCGCSHEHDHEQENHDSSCGCGHDHSHAHHHTEEASLRPQAHASGTAVQKVYLIENLDCANCAAAVERKIAAMPEVQDVSLTFATKQLRITAEDPDALLDKILTAASSVEPGVVIQAKSRSSKKASRLSAENKKDLVQILIGAALFISGIILNAVSLVIPADVILLIGYLLLGGRIILTAGKNLTRGKVFDENFLMSLATIAAICIGDFKEAAGVMLFYRLGELFV